MSVTRIPCTITRPADTTAYTAGDQLVSTAGISAHVLDFGPSTLLCNRIFATKSTTTTANSSLRLYIMGGQTAPVLTGVDNAALSGHTRANLQAIFSGSFTNAVADGAFGVWTDDSGRQPLLSGRLWLIIETTAAYAPGSAESFTFNFEGMIAE